MKHANQRSSLSFAQASKGEFIMLSDACYAETAGVWFPERGTMFLVDVDAFDRAVDEGEEYAPVIRPMVGVRTRWDAMEAVVAAN